MALPDYWAPMPQDFTTFVAPVGNTLAVQMDSALTNYANSGVPVHGGSISAGECKLDVSSQSYSSGWCGFNLYVRGGTNSDVPVFIMKGATTDLLRISTINTSEHWMVEYYNGSGWTQIGADETTNNFGTARRIDINWVIADSGGVFELYLNGTSHRSFTGDTLRTADTTIDEIRIEPPDATNTTNLVTVIGGLVVDSSDTRKLFQEEATTLAEGNSQNFAGAESDVDESFNNVSATNYMTAEADNDKHDFTWVGMDAAVTDSWTVEGVRLAFVTRAVTDPGWYFHGYARISGVDYDFGTARLCPGTNEWGSYTGGSGPQGYTYHGIDCHTDPSTSPLTAWTNKTAVEGADFGIRAEDTA